MPQFDREILNNLKIDKIKNKLKLRLEKQPQIVFAYLHGSILSADSPRDIDIAVYLYADDFNASHLISKRGFRAPEDYADTFKVLFTGKLVYRRCGGSSKADLMILKITFPKLASIWLKKFSS